MARGPHAFGYSPSTGRQGCARSCRKALAARPEPRHGFYRESLPSDSGQALARSLEYPKVPRLHDLLPPAQRLALAVRSQPPTFLARAFAAHAGQFYDRDAFDTLAREVSHLYAARNPEDASRFRQRLNRRLYDRYHSPVAWDVSQVKDPNSEEAA